MSHVVISDPCDIASRFSQSDRLGYDGFDLSIEDLIDRGLAPIVIEEDVEDKKKLAFDAIEKYLYKIPLREQDLITLYHRDNMKQEQIAKIFGITQAAVSYRLHRGIKRIQFLRTIPELDLDAFQLELGSKFSDQDREILWLMYQTTCQSEVAKQMGLTQGRVRHRFFRALIKIKELIAEEAREVQIKLQMSNKRRNGSPPSNSDVWWTEEAIQVEMDKVIKDSRYAKYWTVFFAISDKHFNILHEVSLPQFQNRGDAQILPIG